MSEIYYNGIQKLGIPSDVNNFLYFSTYYDAAPLAEKFNSNDVFLSTA